jgi:hypothetical protein
MEDATCTSNKQFRKGLKKSGWQPSIFCERCKLFLNSSTPFFFPPPFDLPFLRFAFCVFVPMNSIPSGLDLYLYALCPSLRPISMPSPQVASGPADKPMSNVALDAGSITINTASDVANTTDSVGAFSDAVANDAVTDAVANDAVTDAMTNDNADDDIDASVADDATDADPNLVPEYNRLAPVDDVFLVPIKSDVDTNAPVPIALTFHVLIMRSKKGVETVAKYSHEDLAKVSSSTWSACNGYASGIDPNTKRRVRMHNFLMGKPPRGKLIDHINYDRADNRRENLRVATIPQNNQNKVKRKNTSSSFVGVSKGWKGTWDAQCGQTRLGRFHTAEAAAYAYDQEAIRLYGAGAPLNGVARPSNPDPIKKNIKKNLAEGVSQTKTGRWYAYAGACIDPKTGKKITRRNLGTFDTFEEAKEAAIKGLIQRDKEKREFHLSRPIKRDAQGNAIIATKSGKNIIVDDNRWHELVLIGWCLNNNGYAVARIKKQNRQMHRWLMGAGPDDPDRIDHINHNELDNRMSNLRRATDGLNNHNRTKALGKSTRFPGVYKTRAGRFIVGITANHEDHDLGTYKIENVASWTRDQGAIQYYGVNASLNGTPQPPGWIYNRLIHKAQFLQPDGSYVYPDGRSTAVHTYKVKEGGFLGVSQQKCGKKRFSSEVAGKKLGLYDNKFVAAWTRDQAAIEILGDRAQFNNVPAPAGWRYNHLVLRGEQLQPDGTWIHPGGKAKRKKPEPGSKPSVGVKLLNLGFWQAMITIDKKPKQIGTFPTRRTALWVRDQYAKEHLGSKAKLSGAKQPKGWIYKDGKGQYLQANGTYAYSPKQVVDDSETESDSDDEKENNMETGESDDEETNTPKDIGHASSEEATDSTYHESDEDDVPDESSNEDGEEEDEENEEDDEEECDDEATGSVDHDSYEDMAANDYASHSPPTAYNAFTVNDADADLRAAYEASLQDMNPQTQHSPEEAQPTHDIDYDAELIACMASSLDPTDPHYKALDDEQVIPLPPPRKFRAFVPSPKPAVSWYNDDGNDDGDDPPKRTPEQEAMDRELEELIAEENKPVTAEVAAQRAMARRECMRQMGPWYAFHDEEKHAAEYALIDAQNANMPRIGPATTTTKRPATVSMGSTDTKRVRDSEQP